MGKFGGKFAKKLADTLRRLGGVRAGFVSEHKNGNYSVDTTAR